MKRKAESQSSGKVLKRTKKAVTEQEAKQRFLKGLFDKSVLDAYTKGYAKSTPYRHSVIHQLVDDKLLRAVRSEIRENVSFTPKETDIYKIHQSGDLANLDGLEDDALAKLPSLLSLRDAIYSETFRDYVSHITGCGPLSGRKTDMAINVYTPGCYLLCHDDVIGSRKVSYILYLTDPDNTWKPEWGGALRLFPYQEKPSEDGKGEVSKIPGPYPVKVIPPAWNQLSFFAVMPGESFHDVEEVYHAANAEQLAQDGGRVRMAISGWFHIPQPGEAGFVQGAEEAQLKNSGLMQLQGNPDQHDRPLPQVVPVSGKASDGKEEETDDSQTSRGSQEFNEADLEFLLKYLAPVYLTPDTLSGMAEHFQENSSITLPNILNASFSARLRAYIEKKEAEAAKGAESTVTKTSDGWHVALPPHKHRYMYLQQGAAPLDSPWHELIDVLLPSMPFRTWLEIATDTTVTSHDLVARRFRHGLDYTLATGHEGEARLELNMGLTPTEGWGEAEDEEDDDEEEEEPEPEVHGKGKGKAVAKNKSNGESSRKKEAKVAKEANGKSKPGKADKNGASGSSSASSHTKAAKEATDEKEAEEEDGGVGGHEVYMAGDDDETEDAAIYRTSTDDDNILFFQAAAWNKMTIVLRDSGTLRFVKYVNQNAPGDRWDVSATFDIEDVEGDEGDEEDDEDPNAQIIDSSEEEELRGFSSSEDSDSE